MAGAMVRGILKKGVCDAHRITCTSAPDGTAEALALETSDWEAHNTRMLYQALEQLDERSRTILAQRWLAEEKTTLQELADRYGVTAERIRQLEKSAMKKLQATMAA